MSKPKYLFGERQSLRKSDIPPPILDENYVGKIFKVKLDKEKRNRHVWTIITMCGEIEIWQKFGRDWYKE